MRKIYFALFLLPCLTGGCTVYFDHFGYRMQSPAGPMVNVHITAKANVDFNVQSEKWVYIDFGNDGQFGNWVTEKQYSFTASDLDWKADWRSPTEVVVTLFDYGLGVSRTYDEKRDQEIPKRIIAVLRFVQEQKGKTWIDEAPEPATSTVAVTVTKP